MMTKNNLTKLIINIILILSIIGIFCINCDDGVGNKCMIDDDCVDGMVCSNWENAEDHGICVPEDMKPLPDAGN